MAASQSQNAGQTIVLTCVGHVISLGRADWGEGCELKWAHRKSTPRKCSLQPAWIHGIGILHGILYYWIHAPFEPGFT